MLPAYIENRIRGVSSMAANEEKAAEYIARAAELWKAAADAEELVDRDALIKAAKVFERMAQRILQPGAANHDQWQAGLRLEEF